MKIVSFAAENVKHLKVVEIRPDGSLVVIGGDNAAGKSCVLDSIEYALGGANSVPSRPIRAGQKKARVVLDLDDIKVIRTFTEKGTSLVVKDKDGDTFSSPQAMLNELVGQLAFDPLEFSKMDAKQQATVLKQLVGIDFSKKDEERKKLFDKRTEINRRGKDVRSRVDALTKHDDVPDKPLSIQALGEKYTEALSHNQGISTAKGRLDGYIAEINHMQKEIKALEKRAAEQRAILEQSSEVDVEALRKQMDEIEDINRKVQENADYLKLDTELQGLRQESLQLTAKIEKIDDYKTKTVARAKFPIDGLVVGDDGVMFNDTPLSQCSSAEQIKISVAIGLAMNPELRILLIREGSLLDEKNLGMIASMAEEADAQIWIERVSRGKECSVIMEDGSAKEL